LVEFTILNNASTKYQLNSNRTLNLNTWYHIVGVQDAATGKSRIYIDGVFDKELSITNIAQSTVGWWMAQMNNGTYPYRFDGLIDEARIENTVRSADWIRLCYENQREDQTLVSFGPVEGDLDMQGNGIVNVDRISAPQGQDLLIESQADVHVRMPGSVFTIDRGDPSTNGRMSIDMPTGNVLMGPGDPAQISSRLQIVGRGSEADETLVQLEREGTNRAEWQFKVDSGANLEIAESFAGGVDLKLNPGGWV
jgi:hypothetical protein